VTDIMPGPIERLRALGQSVWLDFIRRGHLVSGEFDRLVREHGVTGVTSNPTIFQQAIVESDDYDEDLRREAARGLAGSALFEALAIEDIRIACDRLREAYERTGGVDGRVSIEVSPRLAHDTRGTLAEALRLHREVGRPNVMVKIPATAEGLPAITAALAEGVCVNVTLIFSLARYAQVMDAYLKGLEQRLERGQPLDSIVSVASFFVSRVDSKVDQAIDRATGSLAPGSPERAELESLRGQAAVANARLAYARFREVFTAPRFEALRGKGARVQRPLWASTSAKNPAYRDVIYVEELIGPDTVNTMPLATLTAFEHHGVAEARIGRDLERARALFERLTRLGVPIEDLIARLEPEGVAAFTRSYDIVIEALETRRRAMHRERSCNLRLFLGDAKQGVEARLERLDREQFAKRLWERDASLWGSDPAHQQVARNRLGWLEVASVITPGIETLKTLAKEVARDGYQHAVLLGMGGSSLAPEVMRRVLGVRPGLLNLTVLDSTSPAALRAVTSSCDPGRTLFLVSSKSGTTVEVASFERHFFEWVGAALGTGAGRSFVAITDAGTPLEQLAAARGYRAVFVNPSTIGGRYSALSLFGLVPAALIGADLDGLRQHALDEARGSGPGVPAAQNLGLHLGAMLGELALSGRDKMTLVLGPELEPFGHWVEQLVAESTGKDGKGLVPVTGEPLGPPGAYGRDRAFVAFSAAPFPPETDAMLDELERAGHPVVRWRDPEPTALGAEFLRWEIATVTASAILGVDPFDEPNVTEAKQATRAMLEHYLREGSFPGGPSLATAGAVTVEAPAAVAGRISPRVKGRDIPAAWVAALLSLAQPGDYFGLLAYFHRTPARHQRLERVRLAVRGATRLATTLGYGPRFLHSTGQLHKGGPNTGIYLQLTADEDPEIPISGEAYGFGALIRAQAAGDYQVLERRGRRVMRVHLGADPEQTLDEIAEVIAAIRS
jgi:transaldolase/glucose-6-phosphate isomerase